MSITQKDQTKYALRMTCLLIHIQISLEMISIASINWIKFIEIISLPTGNSHLRIPIIFTFYGLQSEN